MSDLKFLHISDTHFRNEYGNSLDRWMVDYNPVEIIETFLKEYNFTDIDFVAHTGDLIHDVFEEDYASFKALIEKYVPSHIPVYYCLGNHDNKKEFYRGFFNKEEERPYNYVETVKGYRLVFLDTSSEDVHDGKISQELEDWLFEQLKEPSEKGTLIFQHHPLEISWVRGFEQTEVSDDYIEKLNQTDVLGIFTGHLHQNRHVMIGNIPQHTAGAFVFGMNRIDNKIWNTNRLGYSEVELYDQQIDVYTEIVNPSVREFNIENMEDY